MKEMSLTRALNEVKMTEKKISQLNAKNNGWLTITKNGKLQNSMFDNLDQFKAGVKKDKQRLKDLVTYRNEIKSKLLIANNSTTVTVNGEDMTIAEAIDRKAFSGVLVQQYRAIKGEVDTVIREYEYEMDALDTKVENTINKALEGDGKKDPAVIKGIEDSVRENNKIILEDPSNIRKWIEEQFEATAEFLNEVDFCLSEINAKTTITVED